MVRLSLVLDIFHEKNEKHNFQKYTCWSHLHRDAGVTAFLTKTGSFKENGNSNLKSRYQALPTVFALFLFKCDKMLLRMETQQK